MSTVINSVDEENQMRENIGNITRPNMFARIHFQPVAACPRTGNELIDNCRTIVYLKQFCISNTSYTNKTNIRVLVKCFDFFGLVTFTGSFIMLNTTFILLLRINVVYGNDIIIMVKT